MKSAPQTLVKYLLGRDCARPRPEAGRELNEPRALPRVLWDCSRELAAAGGRGRRCHSAKGPFCRAQLGAPGWAQNVTDVGAAAAGAQPSGAGGLAPFPGFGFTCCSGKHAETKASIVNSDVCLAWKRRRILSRLAAGRKAGTCPQASVLGCLGEE